MAIKIIGGEVRKQHSDFPSIEELADQVLYSHHSLLRHIDGTKDPYREARVTLTWSQHGIPTRPILKVTRESTTYRFVPGITLREALQLTPETVFTAFLEVYHRIRDLQKGELMHIDGHASNYLFSEGQVIPIDPDMAVNPQMDWKNVDGRVAIYTMLNLSALNHPELAKDFYLSFSSSEQERIRSLFGEHQQQPLANVCANILDLASRIKPDRVSKAKMYGAKNLGAVRSSIGA